MNQRIDIVRARQDQASSIMEVIRACVHSMRRAGIFQWDEIYPSRELIEEDVRDGSSYLAQANGVILGAVCLNEQQDAVYQQVRWCGIEPVLVVHRLCVDPACQGQGIASRLMDFAEEYARQHAYASIRLDAYTGNPSAVKLYETRGYRKAGQVYFPRRELPFYCFEKILVGGAV
jgi:ribosomal protein S18 acetylase RimI-like enzyme